MVVSGRPSIQDTNSPEKVVVEITETTESNKTTYSREEHKIRLLNNEQ